MGKNNQTVGCRHVLDLGNHGEGVKEYYFSLDGTPTHAYMKMLHKHPQGPYPCNELVQVNGRRAQDEREFKLFDAFARYFPKHKLYNKLNSMFNHLGMHPDHSMPRNLYMKNQIDVGGLAHQAGTCRFGADAKSSVLDVNCRAHELDNLYVVYTSFFPSIGAVNPALTGMANALRVGDPLLERLK